MVIIDADALKTLELRDIKAGLAEVVKYGIIKDSNFFSFLEQNYGDMVALGDSLLYAIKMSCMIKAGVVEEDERESGLRAILNFGHTFGQNLSFPLTPASLSSSSTTPAFIMHDKGRCSRGR